MKNYSFPKPAFDINGNEIYVQDLVNVPEPNDSDIHNHEFTGTAIDHLDNGNIIVEDQESNFYEIEASRLEISEY
jgi:hypothetical protein